MNIRRVDNLVWFRRDLRCDDQAALSAALTNAAKYGGKTYCVFVFDREILDDLPATDRRVSFIYQCVLLLREQLRSLGGELIVLYGDARQEIVHLAKCLQVGSVFVNQDYEPQALVRDADVAQRLLDFDCEFFSYKDQVIFECDEVLTKAGTPYSVFTPYKRACLSKLMEQDGERFYAIFPVEQYASSLASSMTLDFPSLEQMGFQKDTSASKLAGSENAHALMEAFLLRIEDYADARNFPALSATSSLSVHLRFGTISIRTLVRESLRCIAQGDVRYGASTWLSELIWRDFYFMLLAHYPHVVNAAFKSEYAHIVWESGELAQELFLAWCEGRTGYPLVDAAMLQLNQTGYMHNRLRMVSASFLVKHLELIGVGVNVILLRSYWILTYRQTMVVGNGLLLLDVMHNLTFGFLTQLFNQKNLIRKVTLYVHFCRSWQNCRQSKFTLLGV